MSVTSLVLMLVGSLANLLVASENGGVMPVAMSKEDILFVIGPAKYGVTYFDVKGDLGVRHGPLRADSKLRLLADRIPIAFPLVHSRWIPAWGYSALDAARITPGEDSICSFGDLLLWLGFLFAIPSMCALLTRFAWRSSVEIVQKIWHP